jgi:hypothetical protein
MGVLRQVPMAFGVEGSETTTDLSAISRSDRWLWVAGDEKPLLDRLTFDPVGGGYGEHRAFSLGEFIDLPEGPEDEVDVEGLDRIDDVLWVVGSHSRTRKKVDDEDGDSKGVRNLATVRDHPNRHLLLRLPVGDDGTGPVPMRSTDPRSGGITAAALPSGAGGLTDALTSDEHLAPFLPLPGKDNGLDIEGVVAIGDRILLGLRGPVLRGWAVVLELRVVDDPTTAGRLALGEPLEKRFLDLDGLGVRDLCRFGDDLLVLAGPTMDLDGPTRLHRWRAAVRRRETSLVRGDQIPCVTELPYGIGANAGRDHPEGVALLPTTNSPEILVVYDSPADARKRAGGVLLADVVAVPR